MEYPKITFSPDSKDANQYAFFGDDDKPSNWFNFIDGNDEHLSEEYARRLCAAWNDCAGIPTKELENGFIAKAFKNYKELANKTEAVLSENAALRAAVAEMARMLPVLEYFSGDDRVWDDAIKGESADLNAYRQTLENALAKMKDK